MLMFGVGSLILALVQTDEWGWLDVRTFAAAMGSDSATPLSMEAPSARGTSTTRRPFSSSNSTKAGNCASANGSGAGGACRSVQAD